MDFAFIFGHGLFFGFVLSLLLTLVFLGAVYLNGEIMLNDYPPDVKKAYGEEKDPKTRGQRRIFSLLFLGALFGTITWSVVSISRNSSEPLTFLPLFALILVEILAFNVWDLLLIDWLVFNTLQPKFIILPGTEGLPGYKDYRFHFRGFLTGVLFSFVSSLVLAGMALMIVNGMG